MKVILTKDVHALGRSGEIREVKDGYARNYLFPRGLALPATEDNVKRLSRTLEATRQRQERTLHEIAALKTKLEELVIEIHARAGEGGRLFGSVTAQDIADAITKKGIPISKKQVELDEPIKSTGFYRVLVRIHPQRTAIVEVNVVGTPSS